MAQRTVRIENGVTTQLSNTHIEQLSLTRFYTERGAKRYELTNHLGNVLTVVTDKKLPICSGTSVSYFISDIVSATDYSPFGAPLAERTWQGSEYRFAFNGKEKDDETYGAGNIYDYGLRVYNPMLGKFLSVDPLFKDYPELTTYQFASNTPIWAIDLDGAEAQYTVSYQVTVDKNGNYVTQRMHKPILTKVDGNWSGIKTESQFFYKNKFYKNQSSIPGWSTWKQNEQKKVNRTVKNVVLITGGIITIVASAGTAAPGFIATYSAISGGYAITTGTTKIILDLNNKMQYADLVPTSFLEGTVGVTLTYAFGDKTGIIRTTANLADGFVTLDIQSISKISKMVDMADKTFSLLNIIITGTDGVNQIIDEKNKKRSNPNNDSSNSSDNSNQSQGTSVSCSDNQNCITQEEPCKD